MGYWLGSVFFEGCDVFLLVREGRKLVSFTLEEVGMGSMGLVRIRIRGRNFFLKKFRRIMLKDYYYFFILLKIVFRIISFIVVVVIMLELINVFI